MAQVTSAPHQMRPITPPSRSYRVPRLSPGRMPPPLLPTPSYKTGEVNLGTFSPVDENGSYSFDRVIKSGKVNRRIKKKGAWKPSWKPVYLVLRPNLLSVYKNPDETGLKVSITLSDITAVATVKKTNTDNVFGVFTPTKNFHFSSSSERDAADWIHKLRIEARTEDREEWELPPLQVAAGGTTGDGFESTDLSGDDSPNPPGSPELVHKPTRSREPTISQPRSASRQTTHMGEVSGNELLNASQSDFSDVPVSSMPKPHVLSPIASAHNLNSTVTSPTSMPRNTSQLSISAAMDQQPQPPDPNPDRVIWQGWLLILKTKGGVRQWKTTWTVLRPRSLSFYKNEQEYSVLRILPTDSIINAAEIDPISRSKTACFQIILVEKTYRLCAADEEGLAKCLGAIKSVLSKRRGLLADRTASSGGGGPALPTVNKGKAIEHAMASLNI